MSLDNRSSPVNIGVVGAGFMGQLAHIDNYAAIEGCRIVALAELRPQLRQKVCDRYGIPRSYETHLELLEDPEVEAIVVVTTRPMIGPIALDCLRAGRHVITEKPMASTAEQAEQIVEAALAHGVNYTVGFMKRHDEGVQRAKRIIDELLVSGELGQVIFARFHCFMGDSYCNIDGHITTSETVPVDRPEWSMAPDWLPANRQDDYAYFLNTFCHELNLLRYLLGSAPSVDFARLDNRQGQVAVFDFDGHLAILETGRFMYHGWDEIIEVYFDQGSLRIKIPPPLLRNVPAQVEIYKGGVNPQVNSPQSSWTWAFRRQAEAFINDVRAGRESIASGVDALEDMHLVEEIWRSDLTR